MSGPKQKIPGRHKAVALACTVFVAAGIAAAYAAVPLYTWFCQATGFGGTTQRADAAPGEVLDRTVRVRFDANVSSGLPWEFRPAAREVEVRIGEVAETAYQVANLAARATAGTATFNVTPPLAGAYFTKIECFCFTEQDLAPGEAREMPVVFFVDPAIAEDGGLDQLHTITLSYTFFLATPPEQPVADAGAKP